MKPESPQPIRFWNRTLKKIETEHVYGGNWVQRLYGTKLGQELTDHWLSSPWVSQLFGMLQSSHGSASRIGGFVKEFKIPMHEFEELPYRSFNDFFIRKFKAGVRPFESDPKRMPAPCEARYFGWKQVTDQQLVPVKGRFLTPELLLHDHKEASAFQGGPMLLARLCPVDYHRFHFPDGGRVRESYHVSGRLHSVNPAALKYRGDIFATNERQVSLFESLHFGRLALIEVGALCVGKIVQTYEGSEAVRRGQEKGYFLFGGSTVIVLGEKGAWSPDADILEKTEQGLETWVKLGEGLAGRS